MVTKNKRTTFINNNQYKIVMKESNKSRRVSVYDNTAPRHVRKKTDIVYRKEWKGRILWFGKDMAPSMDEMVQECLNEAVCILEDKQSSKEAFEDRIEQAISTVEEIHEEQ